jgi:hypothetical protein
MYGIEVFVGSKYGGWLKLQGTFPREDAAKITAEHRVRQEAQSDLTPFMLRAVRL